MRKLGAVLVAALCAGPAACGSARDAAPSETDDAGDWVYVMGDVAHPGRYAFLRGKSAFTLTQLLAMCDALGDPATAKIRRYGSADETVDIQSILMTDVPDVALRPGDQVRITARR